MAINYGLLDTTVPAQIGAIPGNALASYVKARQAGEDRALARQQADIQNALAQMQLTRGRREMEEEDAFRNALAGVQGGDYAGAMPGLLKASPTRALALKKSLAEEQRSGLETQLKRFEVIDRTAGQFAANPTRQTGVWVLSQLAANGTPPEVIQQMSAKLNAARDEDIPQMAQAFLSATQEGMKAHIEQMYPKPGASTELEKLIAARAKTTDPATRALLDQKIQLETTRAPPTMIAITGPGGQQFLQNPRNPNQPAQPIVTPEGTPVVNPAADPEAQARAAAAKARGAAEGEATAKAQADLPRVMEQSNEILRLTDDLLKHPGLKQAVGASSLLQVQRIPGTDARDFTVRLDQIKGKQFLEAFQSLKGAGAITETEGKKATEAIARMDTSSSEREFRQAVLDFQRIVRNGQKLAKERAGGGATPAPASPRAPPRIKVDADGNVIGGR